MQVCGGIAPHVRLPRTKPVDLAAMLPAPNDGEKAKLKQATELRAQLVTALEAHNFEGVITAADKYIPALMVIDKGLQMSEKPLHKLVGSMQFSWTSSFARKPDVFYTMHTIRYEMCMVAFARMLAEGNIGAALLDTVTAQAEFEETAKKTLQGMKAAAGIADFITAAIIPLKEALYHERPPEVVPGFSKAMSALYRSAGQQIACKQATLKSMSPQLLGKLYVAAANLQRECDVELQGLTADYKDIMGTLRNYASGGRGLLLAIGLRHIGNDAWEKKQHGEGLGILREARTQMDIAMGQNGGIMFGASASLAARVKLEQETLMKIVEQAEKDNKYAYFATVRPLDQLPEGKVVTAGESKQYEVTTPPFTEIKFE